MNSAQELIDKINFEEAYNPIDVSVQNSQIKKEVEAELQISIQQELTVPMEMRNIYWAQTLLDTV